MISRRRDLYQTNVAVLLLVEVSCFQIHTQQLENGGHCINHNGLQYINRLFEIVSSPAHKMLVCGYQQLGTNYVYPAHKMLVCGYQQLGTNYVYPAHKMLVCGYQQLGMNYVYPAHKMLVCGYQQLGTNYVYPAHKMLVCGYSSWGRTMSIQLIKCWYVATAAGDETIFIISYYNYMYNYYYV